jgi:hypothetical protein
MELVIIVAYLAIIYSVRGLMPGRPPLPRGPEPGELSLLSVEVRNPDGTWLAKGLSPLEARAFLQEKVGDPGLVTGGPYPVVTEVGQAKVTVSYV